MWISKPVSFSTNYQFLLHVKYSLKYMYYDFYTICEIFIKYPYD